jgi:hypothetical protein
MPLTPGHHNPGHTCNTLMITTNSECITTRAWIQKQEKRVSTRQPSRKKEYSYRHNLRLAWRSQTQRLNFTTVYDNCTFVSSAWQSFFEGRALASRRFGLFCGRQDTEKLDLVLGSTSTQRRFYNRQKEARGDIVDALLLNDEMKA